MAATDGRIGRALGVAAGALIAQSFASTGTSAAGFGLLDDDTWATEAAVLYYAEPDRVTAVEPVIGVKRLLDTDRTLSFRLALDTLTGASGTGATPWTEAQTFTRPSGNGSYTVGADETPLDDTFHDTRVAASASWTGPIAAQTELDAGASFSTEYDYRSIGVNARVARRFDRSNRTLSLGLAYASDTIDPVGGAPVAFSAMAPARRDARADAADIGRARPVDERDDTLDKTVTDLLLGVTQVIDRHSLVQINLGLGNVDGYQNDAYKFLSVVDDDGLVFADVERQLPLVAFENRPDSRRKQTLYTQYKRDFDGRVLDAAYRYGTDDWGIDSHTVELALRIPNGRSWWQPSVRFYTQSAADFYRSFLEADELPAVGDTTSHASADYRLGGLDTWTIGITYGRQGRLDWNATLEYYLQQPDGVDADPRFAGLDLAPDVDALMLRLGTTF